ncbi:MAG: FecR domain-containing protein [Gammaproteobacteria bacterium]|nr:FecR domain-containing protein [Gammaproteobacteria bacterium]MBL7000781.1 FecR domain-containing protein [Gammaproteobacteria bacterium]
MNQQKSLLKQVVVLISLLIVVFPLPTLASDVAGQLVAFSGDVWVSSGPQNPWRKVSGWEDLYPGYSVKTGRLSAASLRMEDESLIRLSQDAEFKVEGVQLTSFWRRATSFVSEASRSIKSSYRLISGKLWGRNNNRNLNTQIITTTATIGIRGTEYMIEASENASTVSIQEGEVVAENERGQTIVRSGEQVVTRAGQAPQRSTLVQSAAAVQWTIQVPELIDLQVLLKKGIKDRSIVKKIEQAYRQSNYATALDLLAQEQRRQPDSSAIQLVRAWIHIKAGNSVGVFPRLKTLSTQYPGDASLQEMMAFSAFLNTQYADARNIIQQLQQRNQLTDTGWVVSAYLHQAAYDLVAAEQAYLKALEINPTSQPAQLQLATLYFASEQNQRALAMVSQLAASNPNLAPHRI